MCSVVVCDSWRRSALRFNLPEDPERRLEWVEFLFEVNGQRLKESSWTDINICSEHFTDGCFKNLTPGTVQLKCSAVPSLCVKSEREEPHVVSLPRQLTLSPSYFLNITSPLTVHLSQQNTAEWFAFILRLAQAAQVFMRSCFQYLLIYTSRNGVISHDYRKTTGQRQSPLCR